MQVRCCNFPAVVGCPLPENRHQSDAERAFSA
jgi:hypothetical protein